MFLSNKCRGFTLIEVLVVMVLLSISLSIVLPLTIQGVEKARVNGERQRVLLFIDKVINDSLFLAEPLNLKFKGKAVLAEGKNYEKSLSLSYLGFGALSCRVTSNGIESEKENVIVSSEHRSWKFVVKSGSASWNDTD